MTQQLNSGYQCMNCGIETMQMDRLCFDCAQLKKQKTTTFTVQAGVWKAMWRGQIAHIEFNSKGAAEAYLKTCDRLGKLRA